MSEDQQGGPWAGRALKVGGRESPGNYKEVCGFQAGVHAALSTAQLH